MLFCFAEAKFGNHYSAKLEFGNAELKYERPDYKRI